MISGSTVSNDTVELPDTVTGKDGKVREGLQDRGEISHHAEKVGKDGKVRAARAQYAFCYEHGKDIYLGCNIMSWF